MPDHSFKFRHRILTRFGETDSQGVIFNARYLDYVDLAISVYWQRSGIELFGEDMLGFHVAHAGIDFKQPMRPFEHVELCCRTERMGNSSLTTLIGIYGEQSDDDLRAEITIVHVCVDDATRRPVTIPDHVREKLAAMDGRAEPFLCGERD